MVASLRADTVPGAEPMLDLLALCVVEVHRDGEFAGSGFFVAPGEVLTCAHVVHGGRPITVVSSMGTFEAVPATALLAPHDPRAAFYPQPDAALLQVADAPPDHPSVRLDRADPAVVTDRLQLVAFTRGEHAPGVVVRSGATLHLETLFLEDGCTLYKLREGQVIGGYSGGPLLNVRTGGVCAVVDSSRSETSDLGGFGVPLAAVAALDPELFKRNAAAHPPDGRWARAHQDQLAAVALRAGRRELLPLLAPVVDLASDPDLPPSDLLRPRFAVVPFVERGDLLEYLMLWRERTERLAVLVLTGAGGFGKTRTAAEVCRSAEEAGWAAGLLGAGAAALTELATWPGRLLIAVDYAETRPPLVTDLLTRLLWRRSEAPCRVVLVVRQGDTRQSLIDLFASGDARDELGGLLRRGEWISLGHGEREMDRQDLFAVAVRAFAERHGGPPPAAMPDLRAEHFERPLFVLAAALLRVEDPGLEIAALGENELIGELLDRHEAEYWRRADDRVSLRLHPDDRGSAVAIAALCGLSGDEDDPRLVRLIPALRDGSAERVAAVVRWLRGLYGPAGFLEPDLLAEVLVSRLITGAPQLVGEVLDMASDAQLTRALVVLSRAAARSDTTRHAIGDALDDRLPDLVPRCLRGHPDLVTALRQAIPATGHTAGAVRAQWDLPADTETAVLLGVEIGDLAVAGMRAGADHDPVAYRPALALALTLLSRHLLHAGRSADALAASEESVGLFRDLAQLDPTRLRSHLGWALDVRVTLLLQSGRPTAGIDLAREAVRIYRDVAQVDPAYTPNLAMALNNQAMALLKAGRCAEGLSQVEEAVSSYRTLMEADPAQYRHGLSAALETMSALLLGLGRPAAGLPSIQEAVATLRSLAQADPGTYLPDLAETLNTQCRLLDDVGQDFEALAAVEEAVALFRGLVEANPTRHLHDLAAVLTTCSYQLGVVGRPADGQGAADEAIAIYRGRAWTDPTRTLPRLAEALVYRSSLLLQQSRPVEGLASAAEAVAVFRELVEADRTRFLPDLALALVNHSDLLYSADRMDEGLDLIEEAVGIRRLLALDDPTRFAPALAKTLIDQVSFLTWGESPEAALAPADEAVGMFRALAQADPIRFLPELARSLTVQSAAFGEAGRVAEGLDVVKEAVAIYRPLARTNHIRFEADLTVALLHQSSLLQSAGLSADALVPAEAAVRVLRRLAEADPRRFLPDLARSAVHHADVLTDLGRVEGAAGVFEDALAAHSGSDWSRGVLLLARSQWRADNGQLPTAVEDTVEAVRLLDDADDAQRRSEARGQLRTVHQQNPDLVQAVWVAVMGTTIPAWLQNSVVDDETTQLLIDWIDIEDWDDAFGFLAEHAAILLTDHSEIALEHLVDTFPGESVFTEYLDILRTARARGITAARHEVLEQLALERAAEHVGKWLDCADETLSARYVTTHAEDLLTDSAMEVLATRVVEDPSLLIYQGLLGLCRALGVEQAYALLADLTGRADLARGAEGEVHELDLARLRAGLDDESADAQLDHALAAARVGAQSEAEWAITRCRDTSASWERPSLIRRLAEFTNAHAHLDLESLRRILTSTDQVHGRGDASDD